ncbi:MAG TPA: GDSL-type esterase/lipase family protein [Mucilaginibacter sp.]|jgi:lysophospholipase L1-like esterase
MTKKYFTILFSLILLTSQVTNASGLFLINKANHNKIKAPAGSPGDKHLKYFGRWDFTDPTQFASYWGGAYIKTNFTGTTIALKVGNTSNFFARIDNGPWVSYLKTGGTINLTPEKLRDTVHSIIVAQGKDYDYVFNFQGFILDAGAVTKNPSVSKKLVEYIGDSITTGYTDAQANVSDYGWIACEDLGFEHTQIAYPGINLCSGFKGTGMDAQYFKSRSPKYPTSEDWNFKSYTPKAIVINLGTNDNANKIPDSVFQKKYIGFLTDIRSKFPKAQILVMRTFIGLKEVPTLAAVNARNAAGDKKVHYINTSGWITRGSADYNDGAHPSVSGQIKAAKALEPVLLSYLK